MPEIMNCEKHLLKFKVYTKYTKIINIIIYNNKIQ